MADEVKTVKTTETVRTSAHPPVTTTSEPRTGLLSNVLAIVGFIILIVIILWGLFHIATLGGPWLNSLFNRSSSPSIQVEAPARATSGQAFNVSWKYSAADAGTYAFLYQCSGKAYFETQGAGTAMVTVPCGAAFPVLPTNNTIKVVPMLTATSSVSVPLSIIFMPNATTSKQAQGSATVIIEPKSGTVTATPPAQPAKPITPKPATPVTPRVSTPADISVRITSLTVDQYGNGVAQFDIGNIGGS